MIRCLVAGVALGMASAGCTERSPGDAEGSAPSPVGVERRVPAAASASPAAAPWYVGSWSGSYDSTLHRMALPPRQGGIPEWAADDGKEGAGKGALAIHVDAEGVAHGTGEGALGPQGLSGAADSDLMALTVRPADAGGFGGTLVAHRDGPRLVGTLTVSTGDSRLARVAALVMARAP